MFSANAVALYCGSAKLICRSGYRVSWRRVFSIFFSPSRKTPGYYLSTGSELIACKFFAIYHSPFLLYWMPCYLQRRI